MHLWLAFLGVVVVPAEAFYDVDLYRWWAYLALERGHWPVLDEPWVYPAGALVPMLLPALGSTASTVGYALGWCAMVTALDGAALAVLLRRTGRTVGGWWWLGFLVLLGPVAMGRLDAVVAPLMVVALVASPRVASVLLTVGAWIKVAPGALLIPLAAAARRPVQVLAPAAAVCVVVVTVVAAGGGLSRVASFLTSQRGRGLQVESVTATPWVLASLVRDDVDVVLNPALTTYEVTGPGTATAAAVVDLVLVAAVAAVAVVLVRHREAAQAALLPASLVLVLVLLVANKVGSPQLLAWLAAPLAVALCRSRPRGLTAAAGLTLLAAGLTQVVFPWGYPGLLTGQAGVTVTLAVRNVVLVAILACAVVGLRSAVSGSRPPAR